MKTMYQKICTGVKTLATCLAFRKFVLILKPHMVLQAPWCISAKPEIVSEHYQVCPNTPKLNGKNSNIMTRQKGETPLENGHIFYEEFNVWEK